MYNLVHILVGKSYLKKKKLLYFIPKRIVNRLLKEQLYICVQSTEYSS